MTLYLSAVPCCQLEDPCDEPDHEVTETSSKSGADCPDSEEPCSPFYVCGACPGCIETAVLEWGDIPIPVPRSRIVVVHPEPLARSWVQKLLRPPIAEFS